jgi:hypothetical protein
MLLDEQHLIFHVLSVIIELCNCVVLVTQIKYGVKCIEEGRHDKYWRQQTYTGVAIKVIALGKEIMVFWGVGA